MHDDEQIGRLFDLNASILAGHIPPRIIPNLGFGYGYPFFNFYPPLAYYVGEVFHLLGFGFITSTKLMLVAIFMLSAAFMYLFSKEFSGRLGAMVASVAYVFASYHAVDVYVRGAFAESIAFVFIPLVFWAVYKLSKAQQWRYVLIGALAMGGLILSHNLITLMTIPFLGGWFFYCLYVSKNRIGFLKWGLILLGLGFSLTAYFWLPSYTEKDYTLVNILTQELANYSLHFVCVYQLWDSPWGYGGSISGCYDGISYEVGKIQLIMSFAAFLFAAFFILSRKKEKQTLPVLLFSAFLFVCLFLMTKFSKIVWDNLSPLWYIQFPWRFLLIASFISAFLSGSVVGFISNKAARIVVSIITVSLIAGMALPRFAPERYVNAPDSKYTNQKVLRWDTSSLAYEYVPKGIATMKSDIGTTKVDIQENEIATSSSTVIKGDLQITEVENKPQYKKFQVTANTPGVIQINTYSFPGWQTYVDGKRAIYQDANKLKLIQVSVPMGVHILEAKFTDTPVRSIGNGVSIISIIVLVTGSIFYVFRKNKKKSHK